MMTPLHYRRREAKMLQKQLAEMVGVSRRAMVNYENGTQEPNVSRALLIAHALQTTVAELFGWLAFPPPAAAPRPLPARDSRSVQ